LAEPRFLVPGAVLHLAAILLLIVGIRQLRDLAGRNLAAAARFVDEVSRFEDED
jgi:hypothetical protein